MAGRLSSANVHTAHPSLNFYSDLTPVLPVYLAGSDASYEVTLIAEIQKTPQFQPGVSHIDHQPGENMGDPVWAAA